MPGVAVDGNDVFAVYEAAKAAIERARNGGGPSLLEAKTYRVKGHFVGDPELYRSKEEVEEIFKKRDPISRFEKQVLNEGLLSQKKLDDIKLEAQEVIDNALAFAKASPEPDPSELLSDVYA
jgi:pyruvate dehydrogenase E1 component alpha subunit